MPDERVVSEELVSHWRELPGWHPGRRLWGLYAIPPQQDEGLNRVIGTYQSRIADVPQLDLVAAGRLHLSLQGLYFTDAVGRDTVQQIAKALRPLIAALPAPRLSIGVPDLDHDAVSVPLSPGDGLAELKRTITRVAEATANAPLHDLPMPKSGFRPHITIAYANTRVPGAQIRDLLDEGGHPQASAVLPRLSLVQLWREPGTWTWQREAELDFAGVPDGVPAVADHPPSGARVSA